MANDNVMLPIAGVNERVARALRQELATLQDLRPHAQLSIRSTATLEEIDRAYARLRGRYETLSRAEYGPAAATAANEIAALLRAAHARVRQEASDAQTHEHERAHPLSWIWHRLFGRTPDRRDDVPPC
jgi:hypothetical protein